MGNFDKHLNRRGGRKYSATLLQLFPNFLTLSSQNPDGAASRTDDIGGDRIKQKKCPYCESQADAGDGDGDGDGAGWGVQRGAADAVVQTERSQDAAGRTITCCSASIRESWARRDARGAAPFADGDELVPEAERMFGKF